MQTQVGKCYYHPDMGSVALCAKCGVGLCRDCAISEGGKILCPSCANELLKQEHKEYRKWIKERGGHFVEGRDFIRPGVIGLLMILVFAVLEVVLDHNQFILAMFHSNLPLPVCAFLIVLFAYLTFSIPFGYIIVNDLFTPRYHRGLVSLTFAFTVTISVTFGWIIFAVILVQFFARKKGTRKDQV